MATATPTFTNTTLGYQATPNANATQAQIASGENSLSKQGFMPTQTGQPAVTSPTYTPSTSGSTASANNYSVVTSQPAQDNYSSIQSTYNNTIAPNIAAGTSNTAATTAANNASNNLPVINGYNVSATPTGAQGETKATNNANGQSYYIAPQKPPVTASDVQSILSGGSQDTSGENGTVQPNTSTTPTPAQTATAQTGIDPNAETANYQNQITTQQSTLDSAYSTFQSMVQTIQSGSFPLSGAQQALVDATNQAFQQMTTESNLKAAALSSETGGVSNMVNATQGELLNITSDQAAAVAKLELGFQNQDYTEITDSYKAFTDAETQKMDSIQKLHDSVMATYNSALDAAQKQQTLDMQQQSAQLTAQQDAIDNQLKSETLSETTRAAIATEATAAEVANKGLYQVKTNPDGTQSIFNTATGQLEGSGASQSSGVSDPSSFSIAPATDGGSGYTFSTGYPAVDSAGQTSAFGVPYIDTSNMSEPEKLQAAEAAKEYQNQTGKILPIVTAKNMPQLQQIESSASDMQSLDNLITSNGLASSNIVTRPFNAALQSVEGATEAKADLDAVNTYGITAMSVIKSLVSNGRMPTSIIEQAQEAIPQPSDTVDTVQSKITALNTILGNAEKGIMGSSAYEDYNPSPSSSAIDSYMNTGNGTAQTTASNSTLDSLFNSNITQ